MKIRKYGEMENMIRNASKGAVLVVAGPDLYQSGHLRSSIVKRFRESLGYEIFRYDGDSLREGDLKGHLLENSLFSSGKLIVISKIHKLGKSSKIELFDAIEKGLGNSALFLSSEKVPRESTILKQLEKEVPVFTCYEPYYKDMFNWANKLATEERIKLKPDAMQLLIEYSGRNLRRLSDAVVKIAIYHGSGSVVDRERIIEVISGKGGEDIFHLGDMIFSNMRGEAVNAAWSLLRYGEEPLGMIAYLFGLWRKVITAIETVAHGGTSNQVSEKTGARYPLIDKLMKFSKTAHKVDTAIAAEAFAEADYGIKTGADSLIIFTRLIFALTKGRS